MSSNGQLLVEPLSFVTVSWDPTHSHEPAGYTHTHTLEITLQSAPFHMVDARCKVLTHLWPTDNSAHQSERDRLWWGGRTGDAEVRTLLTLGSNRLPFMECGEMFDFTH